jgi:hypothetical protein
MDFAETRAASAREIALAFGVPPMLLGIPGDNTYANYQEANRAFYRLTVLPLVARIAREFSAWLGPAFGEGFRLWYDADKVEGLAAERDALWARIGAAGFLTDDEKREAVGYQPAVFAAKAGYRSDQTRAPAGDPDGGQWIDEGGASWDRERPSGPRVAGDVISVCIPSGIARDVQYGMPHWVAIYDCPGGQSIRREGYGDAPGLIRDPFQK